MWLYKSDEETDENYGKNPSERTIEEMINNSVIIVDKHAGPTSHEITDWTKKIFRVAKAGHSGTLDPMVTGVLPIALGDATKAMRVLMGLDKEYIGVMHLHKEVEEKFLKEAVLNFIGKIKQTPPVKSAVRRVERERSVYFFDLIEKEGKDVLFKVGCEAGTYVRKLCHDLGQLLRVGAHMAELRRTKVGNFTEDDSHSLLEIKDDYDFWKESGNGKKVGKFLIPVEHSIFHIKKIFVQDSAIEPLCNGSPLYLGGITRIQEGIERNEIVAVFSLKDELVCLGKSLMSSKDMLEGRKGAAVKTDRVFMKKGTYPRSAKV